MGKIRQRRPYIGLAGVVAVVAAALVPVFAFAVGGADPDVNNAGVFELDGDVTHEAATTPPYDWTNLFTSAGAPISVAGLINSTFTADPTTNDFAFITGSSKDNIDTSSWMCTVKPVTPKDEIQNSYAAAFIAPTGSPVAGHVLVYMALERGTVSGTSNAAFWIFKQPIACNPATGTFINPSTGAAATHSDGDILLFASFTSGGTTATVQLFTWSTTTGGLVGPTTGQDCFTSTVNLCGVSNAFNPITTPWAPGSVGTNGFFEAGIDLTATVPGALKSSCFSTILADTRASASVTADLHDFNAGSFSLCKPTSITTSQSPKSGVLGTSFSDSATVSGATGSISGETFTFNIFSNNTCSGTPTFSTTGALNAAGTATTSSSFAPTTTGTYYWQASYPGDRASGGLNLPSQSGCTDEPITVSPIPTTTVTNPSSTTVTFGASVTDRALVTAASSGGGTPTGTVTFFVCDPTQTTSGACPTGGTQVGSPVTTAAVANSSPPASTADSASVPANKTGTWCFRAVYTPGGANGSNYTGSSDATSGECFTVSDTSSVASAQSWLPNDSATVNSAHGAPVNGTLTFQLYMGGTCANGGTVVAGQFYTFAVTGNTSSSFTKTTNNTTFTVTGPPTAYSWQVTFTSSDPNIPGSMTCESSSVTISN